MTIKDFHQSIALTDCEPHLFQIILGKSLNVFERGDAIRWKGRHTQFTIVCSELTTEKFNGIGYKSHW
jgi:hypothetical protein